MNCATRVLPHLSNRAHRPALWTLRGDRLTFGDFGRLVVGAQRLARRERLGAGDAVLVLARPGPHLFATIVGLLGLGVTVVFVEPWLPVRELDEVLGEVRPKAFLGSRAARLWALRLRAARAIERWLPIRRIQRDAGPGLPDFRDVDPETPATVTFSSGTTGRPKGLVRSHACMWHLQEMITEGGRVDFYDKPALCVFPNLALLHLGTGGGAVIAGDRWTPRTLDRMADLASAGSVASMACGPGFLRQLVRLPEVARKLRPLTSVTVGGAQTDCWLLERAFELWPEARWTHVYGGSEAEPVAKADAREAVRRSRERGRFQALYLGGPVAPLEGDPDPAGLWVTGPNVARRFGEDGREGAGSRVDSAGRRWHFMGDRVIADEAGWWYAGRSRQPAEEFELEQRLYADLGTSAAFVARDPLGGLRAYGEGLTKRLRSDPGVRHRYPEIHAFHDIEIKRDRRHRARIDRAGSLKRTRRS